MDNDNGSNPPQEGPSSGEKRKAESLEEDGITMLDVLQDEAALEEDAKAVLGNSDDSNCSYHSGGYMKRQALYACVTCSPPDDADFQPAAICLGCSYHCHPSHEVVELYTKRRTRCDCGNGKMKNNPCKLADDKQPTNDQNSYNQNYRGVYCTCHRPYPDPDDDTPDEMIQCVVCEDWFHGRHLQGIDSLPKDNSYAEMICHICFEEHKDIFSAYSGLAVSTVSKADDDTNVSVTDDANESVADDANSSVADDGNVADNNDKEQHSDTIKNGESNPTSTACPRKSFAGDLAAVKTSALFLTAGWREQLCRCDDCVRGYDDRKIGFLLDPEDTVHFYESQATNEGGTQYEEGMKALGSMDRVKQMEAIQGYNEMKESLKAYLKTFADEGKVVTQEDIQEFFRSFNARKRQRLEIPKFCR